MRNWRMIMVVAAAGIAGSTFAADVARSRFGEVDGREVETFALSNSKGTKAQIITYGASLYALELADRHGHSDDVILAPAGLEGLIAKRQFMGATVGRVANRIAKGRFSLDGRDYQVPVNDGANALHGGPQGLDKAVWEVVAVSRAPAASVTLRHVSPDGDMGFPGTLTVTAMYSLDEKDQLTIDYKATTDRPTVVALSNHAYWNLAGEGSPHGAMGQLLTIPAGHFTPVDASLIPTGEIRAVAGGPFDFRTPTVIGARVRNRDPQLLFGRGYDHNWVVARNVAEAPRLVARLEDPVSGRVMEMLSNQPGIQFYSGNFLDGTTIGKSGRVYRQGDAVVLEPQTFPDTVNQPAFGAIRLDPGQTYHELIVLRFSIRPAG